MRRNLEGCSLSPLVASVFFRVALPRFLLAVVPTTNTRRRGGATPNREGCRGKTCNTLRPPFRSIWRILVGFSPSESPGPAGLFRSQSTCLEWLVASGPARNRTWTYGFGGHRPIHWTTGPCCLRGGRQAYPATADLARRRIWQIAENPGAPTSSSAMCE